MTDTTPKAERKNYGMAACAVFSGFSRRSTRPTTYHMVDDSGASRCNRGRLELRAITMTRAEHIPWGARCRRGGCNVLWLQIPDESGQAPAEVEERVRRVTGHTRGMPARRVTDSALLPRAELRLNHTTKLQFGWRLTLDCGHTQDRVALYQMTESASSRITRRTIRDIRPAPRSARCAACAEAARATGDTPQ
jgi:hypothetical protein